jgi:ankyrin repeat protein
VDQGGIYGLASDDPLAVELSQAVRVGDLDTLSRLLADVPGLANVRLRAPNGGTRTPLHLVTDWPGYFPHGPEAVRLLLAAGADPNAATTGRGFETPLHWAASSDDVEVAEALIEGGADIEAPGGSIAGTALANAVGYGCWHVARLLVARGAIVESLWQAAALGLTAQVERFLDATPAPTQDDLDEAFWQACHGGQRRMAEYLLGKGADIDAHPGYSDEAPVAIAATGDTRRQLLVDWLKKRQEQQHE